jgi:ketosteroid isomerase-like protein
MLAADDACRRRAKEFEQKEISMADMTTEAINAALIVSAYEAFSRGDIQSVLGTLAEDIVWHVPGRGPLSCDYRGHTEVLGFFDHFMRLSDGTFRVQLDEVFAKGDRVLILCTETAQRGGRSWSSPQVHAWTIKGGRAIAFRQYQGDQQGEDEFWSMDI